MSETPSSVSSRIGVRRGLLRVDPRPTPFQLPTSGESQAWQGFHYGMNRALLRCFPVRFQGKRKQRLNPEDSVTEPHGRKHSGPGEERPQVRTQPFVPVQRGHLAVRCLRNQRRWVLCIGLLFFLANEQGSFYWRQSLWLLAADWALAESPAPPVLSGLRECVYVMLCSGCKGQQFSLKRTGGNWGLVSSL